MVAGPSCLADCVCRRRGQAHLLLEFLERVFGHRLLDGDLALDVLDAFSREVGRHAHPAAVPVDLVLEDLLGLPEVGRDVEVELGGQLRHLGLGPAHLEVGVVLGDLVLDVLKLLDGVLDLEQVVVVRLLVQRELPFVLGQVVLGPLEIEGELGGGVAITGAQVGLDLGLDRGDLLALVVDLPRDSLDQGPILGQSFAAFLHLLDGPVVFVLHLGDRIVAPDRIGQLVELRRDGVPEFAENHGSPVRRTWRIQRTNTISYSMSGAFSTGRKP